MRISADSFEELLDAGIMPGGFSTVPDDLRPQVLEEVRMVLGHEDDDQLPGQMHISDYPEYMPVQGKEDRGRTEAESTED